MKANKVFVSAPIRTDWSTVLIFIRKLEHLRIDVEFWERLSVYNQNAFDECDSIVFLLPDNSFNATNKELPIGLKNELSRAHAQSKSIYVGYVTAAGEPTIYEAISNGRFIEGCKGTGDSIFDRFKQLLREDDHSQQSDNSTGDVISKAYDQIAGSAIKEGNFSTFTGGLGLSGWSSIGGITGISDICEQDNRLLFLL